MTLPKPLREVGRQPNKAYKKRFRPSRLGEDGTYLKKVDGSFKVSKRGKYNNRGMYLDGKWFASGFEADRYHQLKVLEELGRIQRLELQPKYPVSVDGMPICTYKGDFRYLVIDERGSVTAMVLEDVKGMVTKDYALKKKLVEAKYKLKIYELPGCWMKHYDKLTGPECAPVIAKLGADRKARAKARLEASKFRAAEEAARLAEP